MENCHLSLLLVFLPFPVCQVATGYVYVCECICTCASICVHMYEFMHMHTCNICVIESTTYCYICDKIQCDAVTARSVFSKHFHDRHTIARLHGRDMGVFCELKVWFHIPYQLLQFCIQSGVYIPSRCDGTRLCVLIVPPLTGQNSCSRH